MIGGDGGMGSSSSGFVSGENTADPDCDQPLCDSRGPACLATNCLQVQWARRAGNLEHEQLANSIAIFNGMTQAVAIAGIYVNDSVDLGENSTGIVLPAPSPTDSFREGFVAMYDLQTGTPLWAANLGDPTSQNKLRPPPLVGDSREALSVAFDSQGRVIVAGFENMTGGGRRLILQKYNPALGVEGMEWSRWALGSASSDTQAIAVTTVGTDIYLLGRAKANSADTGCIDQLSMPVHLKSGPFVARLDETGNCKWLTSIESTDGVDFDLAVPTAMTASYADMHGIWFTGTFAGELDVTPAPKITASGAATNAFAIQLDAKDGLIKSALKFSDPDGKDTPLGITTSSQGFIFLVGEADGMSTLAPGLTSGKGAFVTQIERTGPSTFNIAPYTFPVQGVPLPGAKTTGVTFDKDLIYVAGSFAGTLSVMPAGTVPIDVSAADPAGNATPVPFLAVFQPGEVGAPNLLSFDAFPSNATSYNSSFVVLAQRGDYVALGGAWSYDLDFTTHNPPYAGILPPPGGNKVDAFAALFKMPPPP